MSVRFVKETTMIVNPYPGKFVLFEGGDGTGKSTQAQLAYEHYSASSPGVVLTKEPYTKTPEGRPVHLGNEIYQVLKGEHRRTRLADLTLEQFQRYFYFPNRVHHYLDIIIPSLADGHHVFSDRGAASVSYGAGNAGVLYHLMAEQLSMMEALRLPWPDAILIYDVEPAAALRRMRASGKVLDGHEREDILTRVRGNYHLFAKQWPNCHIIDGSPSSVDVWNGQTRPLLDKLLT